MNGEHVDARTCFARLSAREARQGKEDGKRLKFEE